MHHDQKRLTDYLSNWKVIVMISLLLICIGFVLANFLLHFLQQVFALMKGFNSDPNNLDEFSVDWHYLFIFQKERSEEHTSELQSRGHLVCRLLLEKKNKNTRK